jgi:hypothetical protein
VRIQQALTGMWVLCIVRPGAEWHCGEGGGVAQKMLGITRLVLATLKGARLATPKQGAACLGMWMFEKHAGTRVCEFSKIWGSLNIGAITRCDIFKKWGTKEIQF